MSTRLITWVSRTRTTAEEEAIVQWGLLGGEIFAEIQQAENGFWYLWESQVRQLHVRGRLFRGPEEAKDYAETLIPALVRLAHAVKETP